MFEVKVYLYNIMGKWDAEHRIFLTTSELLHEKSFGFKFIANLYVFLVNSAPTKLGYFRYAVFENEK